MGWCEMESGWRQATGYREHGGPTEAAGTLKAPCSALSTRAALTAHGYSAAEVWRGQL